MESRDGRGLSQLTRATAAVLSHATGSASPPCGVMEKAPTSVYFLP